MDRYFPKWYFVLPDSNLRCLEEKLHNAYGQVLTHMNNEHCHI